MYMSRYAHIYIHVSLDINIYIYVYANVCVRQRLINPVTVNVMKTATNPPRVTQVDPRLTHS